MRYIVFGGENYYPRGGIKDYIKEGDDLSELKKEVQHMSQFSTHDWLQIVDTQDNYKIVYDEEQAEDDYLASEKPSLFKRL